MTRTARITPDRPPLNWHMTRSPSTVQYALEMKMTIQVELNAEIEARLLAEARLQGVTLESVAERLLEEAVALRPLAQGNLTVEEFHRMLDALAADSEKLPNLPTGSFTRESFYEDRA